MKVCKNLILGLVTLTVGLSCTTNSIDYTGDNTLITAEGDKIFLVDQTGKKWDLTYAVNHYGFDPGEFGGGKGPFGFRPFVEVRFSFPGGQGYPDPNGPDGSKIVIGFEHGGEARAYAIEDMKGVEIADDQYQFGVPTHVATGW